MADRSVQAVNALVRVNFEVYDPSTDAPITGLGNGDFTKFLAVDGVDSGIAVTVAEVGNGRYTATLTPNVTGEWHLVIRQVTYNARGWTTDFDVTASGLDLGAIVVETAGATITLAQALRLMLATTTGPSDGGGTATVDFFAPDGTTKRLIATVNQTSGNRTATTRNP